MRTRMLAASALLVACGSGASRAPTASPTTPSPVSIECPLGAGTRRLLDHAPGSVTIEAYRSNALADPALDRTLEAFAAAADERIRVSTDWTDDETGWARARAAGIEEVVLQSIHGDTLERRPFRTGMVITVGQNRHVIERWRGGTHGEYVVALALRLLSAPTRRIGIVRDASGSFETLRALTPQYVLADVDAASPLPSDLAAVLVVDRRAPLTADEVRNLSAYVDGGGSLGIFGGTMTTDVSAPAFPTERTGAGVDALTSRWGISMAEDIVADTRCGRVPMRTGDGVEPVSYPPAPDALATGAAHRILTGIESTPTFFCSSLATSERFATLHGAVLLTSSDAAWRLAGSPLSLAIRPEAEWATTQAGATHGPFALAVAVEDGARRLVVVGASSILRDGFLPTIEQIDAADLSATAAFQLAAIDWLAHEDDLIDARTHACPAAASASTEP